MIGVVDIGLSLCIVVLLLYVFLQTTISGLSEFDETLVAFPLRGLHFVKVVVLVGLDVVGIRRQRLPACPLILLILLHQGLFENVTPSEPLFRIIDWHSQKDDYASTIGLFKENQSMQSAQLSKSDFWDGLSMYAIHPSSALSRTNTSR